MLLVISQHSQIPPNMDSEPLKTPSLKLTNQLCSSFLAFLVCPWMVETVVVEKNNSILPKGCLFFQKRIQIAIVFKKSPNYNESKDLGGSVLVVPNAADDVYFPQCRGSIYELNAFRYK